MSYRNILGIAVKENKMYFFDNKIQSLSVMDINNNGFQIIKLYTGTRIIISRMFMCEDCIYMVSWHSNRIIAYDFSTNKFANYQWNGEERAFIYRNHFLYENKIWFVPGNYKDDLICFDILEHKFICCKEYKKEVQKYGLSLMISDFDNEKGVIWTIEFNTNKLFHFDVHTKKMQLKKVEYPKGFAHICVVNDGVWTTFVYGKKVVYIEEDGSIKEMILMQDQDELECYSDIVVINGGVILLPRFLNEVNILKNQGKEIEVFHLDDKFLEIKDMNIVSKINAVAEDNENIYLPPFGNEDFFIINKKRKSIRRVPIEYDPLSILKYYFNSNEVLIRENEQVSLDIFLMHILDNER